MQLVSLSLERQGGEQMAALFGNRLSSDRGTDKNPSSSIGTGLWISCLVG